MKTNRMLSSVREIKNPALAILYAIAAVFLVEGFMELGFTLGALVIDPLLTALPPEWLQAIFFTVDPTFIELAYFFFPGLLVVLWVLLVERRSPRGLGFYKESWFKEMSVGWGIGIAMITVVVLLGVLTGTLSVRNVFFGWQGLIGFIVIMPFWFLQSGVEELLTRGWLLPVVSKHTNLPIGIIVSSFLFSVMHLGNPSVNFIALLNIGLFGLVASLYVLKTDNIWGVAGIHAAWNCFQGNFFGLEVSGMASAYSFMDFKTNVVPEYLSGGGFGPEGSVTATVVLLAVIVWLALDLKKSKEAA